MQQNYRIRPHRPVLALVLLFLTVMAFSLLLVAREANNSEAARTEKAVAALIKAEIEQITQTANDNAIWDRGEVSASNAPRFWSDWGFKSAEGKKFETIAVLDQTSRSLIQFHKGLAVRSDLNLRFGKPLSALVKKSQSASIATGGIVATRDGLMMIAAAPILAPPAMFNAQVQSTDTSTLIVVKPIDKQQLLTLAPELQIHEFNALPTSTNGAGIDIRDPFGSKIASITWRAPTTGYSNLLRALPLIAFVALIHIFFALLLVNRAYSSVKRLENDALIDSLSKLPNRRALRAELQRKLSYGEKSALAFIDLDGFKIINDNHGHAVGDRLIVAVADMLADLCRKSAMVARLGGDEFAILASGPRCVEHLELIAQKTLGRMAHPFRVDERTVVVGASIGLASASLHDFNTVELMRRSDVAMYVAKRTGKMRMCWYDEMLDQRQETARTIESELRDSIDTEAFEMAYQPVFCATSRTLVGVEALLRWASPSRGDIGPSEFIPVAEETGLIDRIGMIALRKVCTDALLWGDIDVSINVSVAQMRNPEFATNLSLVLGEAGFPSHRLILDISENYIGYDPEISKKMIAEIRNTGVRVAVDNYGTGQMSLPYLKMFNVDKIKIDGSLSLNACKNEEGLIILNSVKTVAKALGFQVSAEGIETEHQSDLVKMIGCEQLQGWLFSREIAAAEITKIFHQAQAESSVKSQRLLRA